MHQTYDIASGDEEVVVLVIRSIVQQVKSADQVK